MSGNFTQAAVTLIQLYSYVLLARIVVSWLPDIDRSNTLVQMLFQLTEPVLEPVRRALPRLGMIDLSPLVVFFGLHILARVLMQYS